MLKKSTSKFSLSNHHGTTFNQMTMTQMYKFAEQFCYKKKFSMWDVVSEED